MDQIGHGFRVGSKLGLSVLESSLVGLIQGVLKCVGPEKLDLLVQDDRNILECIFDGLCRPPTDYYQTVTPEEARKVEGLRRTLSGTVPTLLGITRTIASKFPADAVEAKVTGDWLLVKGKKFFPELVAVVDRHGEEGKAWVDRQACQMRDYLMGRIVFDPQSMKFVPAEVLKVAKKR